MPTKATKIKSLAGRAGAHISEAVRNGLFLRDANFYRVFLTIYTLSFVWIFLIPADFWDDLAVKNNPDLVAMTNKAGLLPAGWFIQGLLSLPYRDVIGHSYVFLLYMAVTLLVRRFVAEFVPASEREKNAIALLTAVLPLYLSRFQIAASYYCLSLLLFCIGALLLARTILRSGPILHRIAAYLCFGLAFFTQSFLVLYGFLTLVICLSIARQMPASSAVARFKTAVFTLLRRAPDALALPFAFFFLKETLVKTVGPFVTYNEVTPKGVEDAISTLPLTTIASVTNVTGIGIGWLAFGVALIFAITGTGALRTDPLSGRDETSPNAVAVPICAFGLMLAVFPYAVVHRLPNPFDFADRNQLTMLLVAGAAVTYGVTWFIRDALRWTLIFLVLVWATATNALTYFTIIRDGHTQNAVIRALSTSAALRANKAFLVNTADWPNISRHRNITTAELNCMMKQAFGDESHFAAAMTYRPFDWDAHVTSFGPFRETGSCFRDFAGGEPILLTVNPGPDSFSRGLAVKLAVLWVLDSDRYHRALDGFVTVSLGPVPTGWLAKP